MRAARQVERVAREMSAQVDHFAPADGKPGHEQTRRELDAERTLLGHRLSAPEEDEQFAGDGPAERASVARHEHGNSKARDGRAELARHRARRRHATGYAPRELEPIVEHEMVHRARGDRLVEPEVPAALARERRFELAEHLEQMLEVARDEELRLHASDVEVGVDAVEREGHFLHGTREAAFVNGLPLRPQVGENVKDILAHQ